MLMDVPSGVAAASVNGVHNDRVQFVKPYLMVTNVVKGAMVIVVTFRPDDRTAGLIAPLAGSSILFAITLLWFRSSIGKLFAHLRDETSWSRGILVATSEPCTLPVRVHCKPMKSA